MELVDGPSPPVVSRRTRSSVAVIVGAILVIAYFVAVYVFNVVAFARNSVRGDQLHWIEFVLAPYERGDMSLFEAVTFEYGTLSHSHIPTLVVFVFSYEFLDLSLQPDRVVGVLALLAALVVVYRQARGFLQLDETLALTAFSASILFRSSSTAIFGWSLLQFQMLYVLIAFVYLRSFVARFDSRPWLHAGVAMPAALLLGDSMGAAAVLATLAFLVVLRVMRICTTRVLGIYFGLFVVDLVALDMVFRGQRVHGGMSLSEFARWILAEPLDIVGGLYYAVSSTFVAMGSGSRTAPLLGWSAAPLWFALGVVALGLAAYLTATQRLTRRDYFPILVVTAGSVWVVGVLKSRLDPAGAEVMQVSRYAPYISLVGIGLALLLAAKTRELPHLRRIVVAMGIVVVVFNALGSWSLTDHDDAVAAQRRAIDDIRAYARDEIQDFGVAGGRCGRIPCLWPAWFLYDESVGPFSGEAPPQRWETDLRALVYSAVDGVPDEARFPLCGSVIGMSDDDVVRLAFEGEPLELSGAVVREGLVIPDGSDGAADRLVTRAIRTSCGQSTVRRQTAQPVVVVETVEVPEGDDGAVAVDVAITLDRSTTESSSVDWALLDGPEAGTATVDEDFEIAGGTVTFAPGETTQSVSVVVLGDMEPEGDSETLLMILSNPSANISVDLSAFGLAAAVTIVDDD